MFVADIDHLKTYGGGDSPDLVFTGMLNALKEGPSYSSSMFVFTDASAKDADLLNKEELKSYAIATDTSITFFTYPGNYSSRGMKDYEGIARDTGGKNL